MNIIYYFSLSGVINAVAAAALGIFVYYNNKKSEINQRYALFCLAIFVWSACYAFWPFSQDSKEESIYWFRVVHIGAVFISICFFHFVVSFLKIQKKIAVKIGYILAIFFVSTIFSPFFISTVRQVSIFKYWGVPGVLYYLYLVFFFAYFIYALILLFKAYRKSTGDRRNQILYIIVGTLVGYIAGCSNYVLFFGIQIPPYLNALNCIYVIMFAYAIVRHQLLDIEVIMKKTLIFGGLFTIIYAVFAFFALLGQMFFEKFVTQNRWVSMIPSVLVVTVMLRPLENFLESITDKYLFQKKYDYKKLLKTFTSEVLTVLELDKLLGLTREKLMEIMKIEACDVVLNSSGGGVLNVPIIVKNNTIGTLALGKKKSDEDYTQEDIDILKPLAAALGIAISNARLFSELSKTRAEIAQKEKMATIGTLAAGMAHEIRNPITTIRNFADFLPDKYNEPEFMGKFEKLIPREIDRIEGIARSLLEFSSSEDTGEVEEFSIEEPVKTVIAILEPQYRTSGISIICNREEGHVVRGSKMQLQDAFFNILNYIFAETQKDGKVTVECEDRAGILTVYIRSKDLFVADHIIKDVFEPVSELYREKRGFGFNLFVAKQLLDRNRATLEISSDKNSGSEFRIAFKKNVSGQRS